MSTITTIQSTDLITNSRADINTNFSNLNSDKIETSVLDTDTALAANSDYKVATQKAVKAYVDAVVGAVTVETTTGTTHSLTTTGEKVIVWVKGDLAVTAAGAQTQTITVSYNGVIKDTVVPYNENVTTRRAFALHYTETPAVGTRNITVEVTPSAGGAGSLANVVIIVMKIG